MAVYLSYQMDQRVNGDDWEPHPQPFDPKLAQRCCDKFAEMIPRFIKRDCCKISILVLLGTAVMISAAIQGIRPNESTYVKIALIVGGALFGISMLICIKNCLCKEVIKVKLTPL